MKRIFDFFKSQQEKPWYRQWWPYAVILMYLLVVAKTVTFRQGEGWELQRYDKQVIAVSSEGGELSGTIGLKREGAALKATYNLYIESGFEKNEVCYICKDNNAFSRPCGDTEQYNYAGQVEGRGFSGKGLSGLLAPVFCPGFTKPKNPVEMNVSWSNAVCSLGKRGAESSTEKFYFTGVAFFEEYEDIFGLDELNVFDAQGFTIRDSCHDGNPGSNFQQTDIERAVKSGQSAKSFKLIFGE